MIKDKRYIVSSFYKYFALENPEKALKEVRLWCSKNNILGRILLAKEGISGAICGIDKNMKKFEAGLKKIIDFDDLWFKHEPVKDQVYHKIVVRVKPEIIAFGAKVNVKNAGRHINPKELKRMLDSGKEVIMLDARNEKEYKVGRFKNALSLEIDLFKDFPKKINKIKDLKDKKIVMYCTGGIRCEKSSAYLKEQGFTDVNQIEGGIINYFNEVGGEHFEGGLYVFDDRIVASVNSPISICKFCSKPSDKYLDCFNLDCNKLFICCDSCREKMFGCCSSLCLNAPRKKIGNNLERKEVLLKFISTIYFNAKRQFMRLTR